MTRVPLLLLTGFLGSGKTSLLNRFVRDESFRDTAVVINEAGLVGLDHLLVERGADGVVLLEGGCLCCQSEGGLAPALATLLRRRRSDGTLPFRRVVVETSGLADPAPILQSLIGDIVFNRHFVLAGVVTLVDGHGFFDVHAHHPQVEMQVALADRLIVTKADLIAQDEVARVQNRLREINPLAPQIVASPELPASALWTDAFDLVRLANLSAELTKRAHPAVIATASRRFVGRLSAADLDGWLDHTLTLFGPALLRLKGLLQISGQPHPVVVHAVGGLLHGFDAGPEAASDENRMVLIARDVDEDVLADALVRLMTVASPPMGVCADATPYRRKSTD